MNLNSTSPFLNNKTFSTTVSKKEKVHQATVHDYNYEITVSGTINKSLILFLLLCASATVIWWFTFNPESALDFVAKLNYSIKAGAHGLFLKM